MPDLEKFKLRDFYILKESIIEIRATISQLFGNIYTNNKIMKESAFAFLPISAGSLIMLVQMGKEIPLFLIVMFISTLIPLWVYAKMAKRWL